MIHYSWTTSIAGQLHHGNSEDIFFFFLRYSFQSIAFLGAVRWTDDADKCFETKRQKNLKNSKLNYTEEYGELETLKAKKFVIYKVHPMLI